MLSIALPQNKIVLPPLTFPAWVKKIGDPLQMFRGAMGEGVFAQVMGGADNLFSPASIAGLKLWLKSDAGLTLSTTGFAGTGTVTQVGTAITGVGTTFLSQVVIGDVLSGTLISGTVTAIASNTALTVNASNSGAGVAYTITPTAGVSDRVTTWADQSGNGNNVTQATASKKPSRSPSIQNGLAGILGDGTSDIMQSAAFGVELTQPYTVFIVYKLLRTANNLLLDGIVDPKRFYLETNAAGTLYGYYFGTATRSFGSVNLSSHILRTVANGASTKYQFDGGSESTISASPGIANLSGLSLFGNPAQTFWGKEYIFEVILYGSDIGTANYALVNNYLNSKYAIY